jgi:membrane protease YdiL (CAAX protease family)
MALIGVVVASILWSIVFLSDFLFNFWVRVTLASIVLAVYAYKSGSPKIVSYGQLTPLIVLKGVAYGIFLYLVFLFGFTIFKPYLQVGAVSVYLFKTESPSWFAGSTLVITGMCEEFFWRLYTQNKLSNFFGLVRGLLITSFAYSLIHLPMMNLPLILAALIAGLFWGSVYIKTRSFWIIALSHIVWTKLIFIFLPLV